MLVFEGLAPEDREFMTRYSYIPQPFLFRLLGPGYVDGGELSFGLRLFGPARRLHPYVVVAVERMLTSGLGRARRRFDLCAVTDGDQEVYKPGGKAIRPPQERFVPLPGDMPADPLDPPWRCRLASRTPVHIRTDGRLNLRPSLTDLTKAALRRLKIMAHFYGSGDVAEAFASRVFADLPAAQVTAQNWQPWSLRRYSGRQERQVDLTGTILDLAFDTASPALVQLLQLMTVLNLGKNTSFGFGQIDCLIQPPSTNCEESIPHDD